MPSGDGADSKWISGDYGQVISAMGTLVKVIGPITLLAALLTYFGWVRTKTLYESFGLYETLIDFTTQDYLLDSIGVAFNTIIGFLELGLLAIAAHLLFTRFLRGKWMARRRWAQYLTVSAIILLGWVMTANSMYIGRLPFQPAPSFSAVVWTGGMVLWTYGFSLLTRSAERKRAARKRLPTAAPADTGSREESAPVDIAPAQATASEPTEPPDPSIRKRRGNKPGAKGVSWESAPFPWPVQKGLRQAVLGFSTGLIILGLFWCVSIFAFEDGTRLFKDKQRDFQKLPSIILYSKEPLGLSHSGIQTAQVSSEENAYKYQYSGLKFLVRANGRYYLVPSTWNPDSSSVIILAESDTIRIEVVKGP